MTGAVSPSDLNTCYEAITRYGSWVADHVSVVVGGVEFKFLALALYEPV